MTEYTPRVVDSILDEVLSTLPAIAIEGPKSVGKTATASRRARTLIRADDDVDAALLRADPGILSSAAAPILIDEWQHLPETWNRIRRLVDGGAEPGRFLLTGSAVPVGAGIHSGAGRIDRLRMRPMSLAERFPTQTTVSLSALMSGLREPLSGESTLTLADYVDEILASGFPGIRGLPDRARRMRLDGYLQNVVEKEFAEQGVRVRRPETLRAWLRAYAAATSTTSTYATVLAGATGRDGATPAKTTALVYRDVLAQLWLLDPIDAWQPQGSEWGRLNQAPKHQLADPALAARLLRLTADDFSPGGRGTGVLGQLFESLVTLGVQVAADAFEAHVGHLRTRGGEREVDLIVERADRVIAIEVKLARTADDHDVRHLRWLSDQLGDRLADALVVTTGPQAYRRPDGIGVIPAALLGP